MYKKINLNNIMAEIKKDNNSSSEKINKLSQKEIKELLKQKQKEVK